MSLEERLGLSVGTARSAASEVAAEVAAAVAAVSDLRFWLMRSACHMLFLRRRCSLFACRAHVKSFNWLCQVKF